MAEESKRLRAEMKADMMSQSQRIAGNLQHLADTGVHY
jgi:hypothetical protein